MSENKKNIYKDEAKDFVREISGVNDINKKEPVSSTISILTGYSFFKKAVMSPIKTFEYTLRGIKQLFSFVLPSLEIPDEYKLKTETKNPYVRFKLAQEQFDTNEEDLISLLKGYRFRVAIYFLMFVITIFVFPTLLSGNEIFFYSYPLQLIFCFSFAFLMIVFTLRSSFYHYQIRNKALFSFNKFIRLPGEWFPESIEQVKERWAKNEKNDISKKIILKRKAKKEE